ncbi:hypothetical protein [Umezawaea sp. Da 62-37]|uniref:hypothetical protein n=1 Tax=Umezawaea sp. Da 62-37 TaxID=3075927 RepID=UPI0028F73F06|nr:hypothetical protein [Umezawaea sp. Da 62-37]WNV83318.1 hypothetical protein RM788_34770 [Umezawaea sp. Da 62-37]
MSGTWIRLGVGWSPPGGTAALSWVLWQPGYIPAPWPTGELKPAFTYYACEGLRGGGRGIVARVTITALVKPTEVTSPDEVHELLSEQLFDDDLTIDDLPWHTHAYNRAKAAAPWPQKLVAWRTAKESIGPHVLPELTRFPRTGWLRSDRIAM